MRTGRTIAEKREVLEKAAEREDFHRRLKRQKRGKALLSILGLALFAGIFIILGLIMFGGRESSEGVAEVVTVPITPTIEVIDADTGSGSSHITSRMKEYIGMAEMDFRELGYVPLKAMIPAGAIREVDFYLDGHPGFIKLIIDRGSGVSVEDADRMIRYLAAQGVTDYQYIDVRIDGKAYWK